METPGGFMGFRNINAVENCGNKFMFLTDCAPVVILMNDLVGFCNFSHKCPNYFLKIFLVRFDSKTRL